jgi:hypothetical protein
MSERQVPAVGEVRMIFTQDGDSCGPEFQDLTIEAVDAGGGHFLVLKTERWAFDTVDELAALCRRVLAVVEGAPE